MIRRKAGRAFLSQDFFAFPSSRVIVRGLKMWWGKSWLWKDGKMGVLAFLLGISGWDCVIKCRKEHLEWSRPPEKRDKALPLETFVCTSLSSSFAWSSQLFSSLQSAPWLEIPWIPSCSLIQGGDPALLLSPSEASAGKLGPVLGSWGKEKPGMSPGIWWGSGGPGLWGKAGSGTGNSTWTWGKSLFSLWYL